MLFRSVMNGVFLGVSLQSYSPGAMLETQLVGDYNFPNVMVAIAAGLHFGVSIDEIKNAIAAYTPDNPLLQDELEKITQKIEKVITPKI